MGFLRCRLSFDAPSGFGWTEHFYRPSSDTDITTAIDKLNDLAVVRSNLLGRNIVIAGQFVSDESIFRDSLVKGPLPLPDSKIYNPNFNAGFGLDPDLPSHGFLARYTCGLTGQFHTTRILRGAPDAVQIFPNGPDVENATFIKAWKAYVKTLILDHWCIKFQRWDAGFTKVRITGLSSGAGVLTMTSPAHGLAMNDRIRVGGVNGSGDLPNGVFTVLEVVDVNSVVISRNWGGLATGDKLGYYHKIAYLPIQITDATILRESTRKTGGPTVRRLGRRRARRR